MKPHYQNGISTITAIFLITMMASLAVAGMSLLRNTQDSDTLDVQARRVRQAALAGLEWGKFRVTQVVPSCVASTNLPKATMPATLSPYTVTVSCVNDGSYIDLATANAYRLTAVACNEPTAGACPGNTPDGKYVEALVTATWPE